MKLLAFAASLRRDSYNRKLIDLASQIARDAGVTVDVADFAEFDMPFYNGDVQKVSGLPPGALELHQRIAESDGMMIASPEYNYSFPGTLKNALDWISRARPMATAGKTGLLLSASPSLVGGIRGLWQLRIPLEGMGVTLHPTMFALSKAQDAFNDEGGLKDGPLAERLKGTVEKYLFMAERLSVAVQSER
jgi:NAD(P)H-dependent FMN reductase